MRLLFSENRLPAKALSVATSPYDNYETPSDLPALSRAEISWNGRVLIQRAYSRCCAVTRRRDDVGTSEGASGRARCLAGGVRHCLSQLEEAELEPRPQRNALGLMSSQLTSEERSAARCGAQRSREAVDRSNETRLTISCGLLRARIQGGPPVQGQRSSSVLFLKSNDLNEDSEIIGTTTTLECVTHSDDRRAFGSVFRFRKHLWASVTPRVQSYHLSELTEAASHC